jgi:uncharacterized protein YjbI with pentapeptide repeats
MGRMANPEHVAKLKEGVDAWNVWRKGRTERADFRRADLSSSKLGRVDLTGADLRKTNFHRANLRKETLKGADLSGSILRRADCSGTVLSETDLTGADFSGAILDGANLNGARIGWTTFADIDLKNEGLNGVRHSGSSTVGVDTIYRSSGKIPEIFLVALVCPRRL